MTDDDETVPCVSEVIGTGHEAHRVARIGETSLTLAVGFPDEVERVPGRELGQMLGYARERKFFDLVKRLERERPDFGPVLVRPTVGRGRNQHGETSATVVVNEPMLTERQAILAAISADTDAAWRVKSLVVDVFLAVKRIGATREMLASGEARQLLAKLDAVVRENANLRAEWDLINPLGPGVIGKPRAERFILAPLREAARLACSLIGDATEGAFRRELKDRENQLRLHVEYPASRAQKIENLPILKLGAAQGKVNEILSREQAKQNRFYKELRARTRQTEMYS